MKVGVIMGGFSSERQISLMTGDEMIRHLDSSQYEAVPIIIDEKKVWIEKAKGIDAALIALHGKYGEDGTIQGTLDTLGIPYTGSGVLSSSVCMDKNMSKKIFRFHDIKTPNWIIFTKNEGIHTHAAEQLGYPVVVKPNSGGSSVGVKIVYNEESLAPAVEEVFKWDDEVLIEEYIKGDEITCAILNGELLPIVGIEAQGEFFDYISKYEDLSTVEKVIELPPDVFERVSKAALSCYKELKCSVYARIDMIIKNGIPYVMEINTLPGMTKNSLLPKSAEAAGISFSQLLSLILEASIQK
ncbi:D-alanine--D-alanine ligase [Heyndrickxia acidicola]|uniref:D-alanine--D-alanine ligase n=1 Tax=Heyndrickxia acidicola TaxID=209389 RepID=A0ABU6MHT0_9BACI|nr:D-alanine--D-alanine ligase [Heyndrickxia acidicola]MED1203994.1 D-alanine--D-alanine ligase [Heyndrickxia acidicola]